jgi:hypothetical protein
MSEEENRQEEAQSQMPGECFCMGIGPQATAAMKMGSEKARDHFRNARIEFLRGLRTMLDERIETLSKEEDKQKGAHINVE